MSFGWLPQQLYLLRCASTAAPDGRKQSNTKDCRIGGTPGTGTGVAACRCCPVVETVEKTIAAANTKVWMQVHWYIHGKNKQIIAWKVTVANHVT